MGNGEAKITATTTWDEKEKNNKQEVPLAEDFYANDPADAHTNSYSFDARVKR